MSLAYLFSLSYLTFGLVIWMVSIILHFLVKDCRFSVKDDKIDMVGRLEYQARGPKIFFFLLFLEGTCDVMIVGVNVFTQPFVRTCSSFR